MFRCIPVSIRSAPHVNVTLATSPNQQVIFSWLAGFQSNRKARCYVGVQYRTQSQWGRRDKQAAVCSDSGALKQSEKKNPTSAQILPMEEGQDGEACSAKQKNACKLAT